MEHATESTALAGLFVCRGTKHSVEVLLADMDCVDALELMVIRGGTGAGNAMLRPDEVPKHGKDDSAGGWSKFAGAVRTGAELAVAAAALQPEAWGLQHAEVLQQDTGETTYFVAGGGLGVGTCESGRGCPTDCQPD